jgi:hypothetical protein
MNTCEHYQEQLLDRLYGLLDATEVRELEAHLASCPACQSAQPQAEVHKQLIAAAARAEFPAVRFQAPATPLAGRGPVGWVRRLQVSRRWLVAAAVLLLVSAASLGGGGWFLLGRWHEQAVQQARADYQRLVGQREQLGADQAARLEKTQQDWTRAQQAYDKALQDEQQALARARQEVNARQKYMVIVGPKTIQPGAPNEYIVETRNLNNAPVPAELEARVVDRKANQVVYEARELAKAGKEPGRYRLSLPRDLPVRPDADLVLEVAARGEPAATRLSESLALARTLYVTHLATDKPMYQPGEVVRFRSLTLDRFSLKPTEEDFHLQFTITDPNGQELFASQGVSRVRDVEGREIMGPGQKPVRGIGVGEWPIPPGLAGGEYTLVVRDSQDRFPAQKRKFLVNRYEKPRLNKKLDFGRSSYGPGDEVFALARAEKAEGGLPLLGQPAIATIQIDGKQYDAQGKESADANIPLRTDAAGAVGIRFRLPETIERGEATLAVQFTDGGSIETIVRPIPLILKKLQVEFFPEGGELVAGVPNRVYFQVRSTLGKPADLSGRLVNAQGETVAQVQTLHDPNHPGVNQGMGLFQFQPQAGQKYELKIDTPAGIEGEYRLPEVKSEGVALSIPAGVSSEKEPIEVVVHSAGRERDLLVGAYCRGRLLDHRRVHAAKDQPTAVRLQPDGGIGGVYRVTVFEEKATQTGRELTPRAERLIYRQSAQRLNLSIQPDKTSYTPGDPVQLTLSATDEKGNPAPAILLVAVVDQSVLTLADEKTHRSLPTHFFLTSEVRRPEDLEHADFLVGSHPLAQRSLDLLLGTQGWRRFAEQDPERFKQQHPEDAERMLVSIGQVSPPVPRNAYLLAEQKVREAFDPKFRQLEEELVRAQEAVAAAEADEQFAARQEMLEREIGQADETWKAAVAALARHDDISRSFRQRGFLLLGGLLLLAGVLALGIGLARSLQRGMPYLAAGVVSMALCGLMLLATFYQVQSPRLSERVALATADRERLEETPRAPLMEPNAAAALPLEAKAGEGGGKGFAGQPRADGRPHARLAPNSPPAPPPGRPMFDNEVRKWEGLEQQQGQALAGRQEQARAAAATGKAVKQLDPLRRGAAPARDRLANRALERDRANLLQFRLRERPDAAAAPALMPVDKAVLPERFVVREYAHERIVGDDPKVRTDFTETLYWHPVLVLPQGQTKVSFQLCDSVTSFQVTAYGHTGDSRLGAATARIESRQPFTLEPKLPIEVTASDRIDLPVTIANDSATPRQVSLDLNVKGLSLQTSSADRRLQLGPNERSRRVFRLQPSLREGEATLTLLGTAEPFASDEVQRVLKIVPEGFPVVGAHSDLLEGVAAAPVVLPKDLVPGTLKLKAEVYLTTLADLQNGLEALLREPHGCFEQTSTSNYPNLLILSYLKESNQSRPEIEQRALQLLDRGYAKLTSFECRNTAKQVREGYEWFGGTAPPHEALTAYGLLQFRDMSAVYKVDPVMVERTRQYLMSRKDGKGGFLRNPRALDTFGRAPDHITNAYIVWAVTESGPEDDVTNELARLHDQALGSKDPYFLALVANSLINRGRHDDAAELLKKLAQAQNQDGYLDGAETSITRSGGRALQIETTALAVLAWLKSNRLEFSPHVKQAVTWISKQRGGHGGFGSTQSTILALKALIAYTRDNKRLPEPGTLTLKVGGQEVASARFDKDVKDSLVLELAEPEKFLKPGQTNDVTLEITGKNQFPCTISWSYHALTPPSAAKAPVALSTTLSKARAVEGETVRLSARVENRTGQGQGMTVAILGLPAGLTIPEDMQQLKDMARLVDGSRPGKISAWETRGRELILYWRDLAPDQKIDVSIDLICRVPGEYRGPASRAYLYYNADHKHWVAPLSIEIAAR